METIPTPRTEAVTKKFFYADSDHFNAMEQHAQQLEKELTTARLYLSSIAAYATDDFSKLHAQKALKEIEDLSA